LSLSVKDVCFMEIIVQLFFRLIKITASRPALRYASGSIDAALGSLLW
jgi:hypothetical protein